MAFDQSIILWSTVPYSTVCSRMFVRDGVRSLHDTVFVRRSSDPQFLGRKPTAGSMKGTPSVQYSTASHIARGRQ